MTPLPPPRTLSLPVLLGGLLTTALAVAVRTWLVRAFDVDVFTFNVVYVVPLGGFVLGCLAGSGYAAAARWTGARVSRPAQVAAVQVGAFVAALGVEYALAGPGASGQGVLPWLDASVRAISFTRDAAGASEPLGALGYAVLGCGLAGFVYGSLLPLVLGREAPYCELCGQYMRSRTVGTLPALVLPGRPEEATAALAARLAAAAPRDAHDRLFALGQGADVAAFAYAAQEVREGTAYARSLAQRLDVSLAACPACGRGRLASRVATGQGRSIRSVPYAAVAVSPEIARALDAGAGR